MIEKSKGFRHLLDALKYSWQGLASAWQTEAAFRYEIVIFTLAMPLAFYLGQTGLERAILIGALFFVWIVELINSALEALADRITEQHDPYIKRAKDMASAAVLFSMLNALVVWGWMIWRCASHYLSRS